MAVIVLAGLSGPILLLFTLTHGIHVSPDSFGYLGAASDLAHGKGWTYPFNHPGAPVTLWPPLFPLALSGGYLLGINELSWGLWQGAILFGILQLIAGLGVYRSTEGSMPAALGGMTLTALGLPPLLAYASVVSETLFYPLELLSLFLLATHFHTQTKRTRFLFLAAASTSLCMLTRYAGLSVFMCGCALLVLWPKRTIHERAQSLGIYAVASLALNVVWSLRNLTRSHTLTGEHSSPHRLALSLVTDGLRTIHGWFFTRSFPGPLGLEILALVALSVMVGALVVAAIARGRWGSVRVPAAAVVLFSFSFVHFLFLIAANAFSGRVPPLNDRMLGPAYLSLSLGLLIIGHAVWQGSGRGRLLIRSVLAAGLASLLFLVGAGARSTIPLVMQGAPQSAERMETLESVLRGPISGNPGAVVYANAPNATWFATGKEVQQLPLACVGRARTSSPSYERDIAALGQQLQGTPRVIVVFTKTWGMGSGGRSCPNFSLTQVERDLRVTEVARYPGLFVLSSTS